MQSSTGQPGIHGRREAGEYPLTTALAGAALLVLLGFAVVATIAGERHALALTLALAIVPVAEFALTPLWRAAGIYRYRSPFFFVVERGPRALELHGGTSFDYLTRLRWSDRGARARRIVLRGYLDGLAALVREVEDGRIEPDTRVSGTTHLVGERTARRLGFRVESASFGERLHLLLDAPGLVAMYSFVRGRAAVPRFWRAHRLSARAEDLLGRRATLEAIAAGIDRRSRREGDGRAEGLEAARGIPRSPARRG